MEMYLVVRKADKTLVEQSGAYSSPMPSNNIILTNIVKKYGGETTDYEVYSITDDPTIERVLNGDEYSLIWNDNAVTGLDFLLEESKRLIVFRGANPNNTDELKLEIMADGVDSTLIQCTAYASYESDDVNEVDTDFNETLLVPFDSPSGRRAFSKLQFVNGYAEKNFKTTEYGLWRIPSKYKFVGKNAKSYPNYKYEINALLDI